MIKVKMVRILIKIIFITVQINSQLLSNDKSEELFCPKLRFRHFWILIEKLPNE